MDDDNYVDDVVMIMAQDDDNYNDYDNDSINVVDDDGNGDDIMIHINVDDDDYAW